MRYTEKNIQQDDLLDYAYNQLSDKEEQEMEFFLDNNPFYADTVENILEIIDIKKLNRKSMSIWLEEEFSKVSIPYKTNSNKKTKYLIGVIILIVSIILLCIYIYSNNPTSSQAEKIFATEFSLKQTNEYLDDANNLIISQTSSELSKNDAGILKDALLLYKQQKYDDSLIKLNELINENDEIAESYLYRGMIHVQQEKFNLAKEDFNNSLLSSGTNTKILEESLWNIVLLKIRDDDKDSNQEIKEMLLQLSNSSYKAKANKLLESL